jgi:hypothetical protein
MKVKALPTPDVVRSYYDEAFHPHQPALCLHWGEGADVEYSWQLPEGVSVHGPAPRHFGIRVRRRDAETYQVRLLWDGTRFHWPALTRAQVMGSCLPTILEAIGTDPWHLLDLPVRGVGSGRLTAA